MTITVRAGPKGVAVRATGRDAARLRLALSQALAPEAAELVHGAAATAVADRATPLALRIAQATITRGGSVMAINARLVEAIGSVAGIVGALCMATMISPAAGFALFLVSNLAWMVFSARADHWWMFAQQVLFMLSSLLGLWNWWLGPLVLG